MRTRPAPPPKRRRRPLQGRATPERSTAQLKPGVTLRLAIGRDGVGLELGAPAELECVRVVHLSAAFRGIRFPVDVSGGVDRFRHRRGELQRVEIEVDLASLGRWLAPKLRGVVSDTTPHVDVRVEDGPAVVSVSTTPPAEDGEARQAPALAFDVHWIADGSDLLLVVANPRGADLPATPAALALACASAVLTGFTSRSGALFRAPRLAAAIARSLLPEGGARVPSADGVRCAVIGADRGVWFLQAWREAVPAPPTEAAVRARDVAQGLREADDALATADVDGARSLYLEALERSPRHPEIALRIADVDARDPGRAEAALALIAESAGTAAAVASGLALAELRLRVGDTAGAVAALERSGQTEPAPALAARAFEFAAREVGDAEDAARYLDRALVASPRSTTARWARARVRLRLGRLEEALGDVEHLEALAEGNRGKCSVWMRAGRIWTSAGLAAHAGPLFERALRYAPDDAEALGGLGAALVRCGAVARGAALLTQAVEAAGDRGAAGVAIRLELARVFAERLDDLPAAIAHASTIAGDAREAALARGLEGRWRAALGDVVGAGLAFARLRELAGSSAIPADDEGAVVDLLIEAASLEETARADRSAGQRHLAAALRLRPHDEVAKREYRRLGALLAGTMPGPVATSPPPLATSPPSPLDHVAALSEAEQAARVEELMRLLQANPRNEAVADELALLLEALDRSHELLALLSARLEDATPDDRATLRPRVRSTLERIAGRAAAQGRTEEVALFRDALTTFAR